MARSGHGFTADRRWPAELDLVFAPQGGRSVLKKLAFTGPLRVQRMFYPEEPGGSYPARPAHCYLLHPPGGLVSGDDLAIKARVEPGAQVLLTTPSAGKIYRADSLAVPQRQEARLTITGGALEWLPRETIIFPGARAELATRVSLTGPGRFLGWDLTILGCPAGGRAWDQGSLKQEFRLEREGRPLVFDRLDLAAGSPLVDGLFGLGRASILMTFWAAGLAEDETALTAAVSRLKEYLADFSGRAGATYRPGVALMRYLGHDHQEALILGQTAWRLLRPALLGLEPHQPRLWRL
jgi:urease accessory protein